MFEFIWNWLEPPEKKRAENLLLTKCLQKRYQKQRNSIIIIQKYTRDYLRRLDKEEDIFTIFTRNAMKNREKLFM